MINGAKRKTKQPTVVTWRRAQAPSASSCKCLNSDLINGVEWGTCRHLEMTNSNIKQITAALSPPKMGKWNPRKERVQHTWPKFTVPRASVCVTARRTGDGGHKHCSF